MRHWAEEVAKAHLQRLGYRVVAENYRVRGAEIDLIAEAEGVLVIVEVKQRRRDRFGTPAEQLTPQKLRRLQQAALLYLAERYGLSLIHI